MYVLRWATEPFYQRGWWLVTVLALALVVYVACTAQLALSIAQELQKERDGLSKVPADGASTASIVSEANAHR